MTVDHLMFMDYFLNKDLSSLRHEIRKFSDNSKVMLWHVVLRLLAAGEKDAAEKCLDFIRDPLKPDDSLDAGPIIDAIELLGDRPDVVEWLLDHGADPLHRTMNSWTSLHVAARKGAVGCIYVLLDFGVPVDIGTEIDGDLTPLMEAAATGQVWSALCLLSKGAEIGRVETMSGRTAQMIAQERRHSDVVDLLEYARKNRPSM